MALPKPEPDPETATITIPAATYARLQDIAGKQHRTPDELVTLLIRTYVGDLTPSERRAERVRRVEQEHIASVHRTDEVSDPLGEIQRIGAELFSTEEDTERLLRFIEFGVTDDGR